ncbi:MAG: hypothetical protein EOO81_12225, partial [Oxalobacteraceae bacterium]
MSDKCCRQTSINPRPLDGLPQGARDLIKPGTSGFDANRFDRLSHAGGLSCSTNQRETGAGQSVHLPHSSRNNRSDQALLEVRNQAPFLAFFGLRGLLSGGLSGTSASLGLYADELITYSGAGSPEDNIFNNALLASNPVALDYWNRGYHHIYCANAVIEGVDASSALSPEDRQRFKGEALFVRALVHFYLGNIFGDIPYIPTTNYEVNQRAERQPITHVYEKVIEDLQQAIVLLPATYMSAERTRPNRYAAYALLSRACLYSGRWAEAADAASAVINAADFVLEESLDNVFLKESRSTIWQFRPKFEGSNADEGAT